jgi:hypothetical protein
MTRIHNTAAALLALALLALALAAPAAQAARYDAAIRDCADDGQLQGNYSRGQLQQARNHLPSSLREYSDCDDVLARAAGAKGGGGAGSSGGSGVPQPAYDPTRTTNSGAVAATQQQFQDLKKQQRESTRDRAPARVTIGDRTVTPGTKGLIEAAAHTSPNDLPAPLLAALIAVAAMGALGSALLMRHRWPETRRVALRILGRR